jgi:AP-1 complex subunit gamma-1
VGRVPELGEYFEEKVAALVGDRNHAVAMGGISLAQALLRASPSATLPVLRRALVPQLCRLLQSLIGSGFSLDYDVGGLNDPFLQVKVLRLLRALGEGDAAASEAMADALTHLATAVDGNRNVGQAVLYEALTTILRVRSDDALRTMAVSILARLLTSHTDNNLRYVGLALLHRIVGDPACSETVQQHRSTVLECLGDPDFSIRKRAAEVALALANRATIRPIASHLMNTVLDPVRPADDAKSAGLSALVLTKLSLLSAQFAPSAKWYADTLVYLLACLHDDAKQATMASEIVSLFLRIVANTEEIHRYASELLWKETAGSEAGRRPTEALLQAAAWSVGEYGDLLVRARTAESFDGLVERVASWAGLDGLSSATLCYLITALGKLSHRHEASIPRIRDALLAIARTHARVVEVCGKATETLAFIQNAALRTLLFAKIPADTSVAIGTLPASMSVATAASAAADGIVAEPSRSESPAPALDVFAELAMLSLDGLASKASSSAASSLASNLPSPLAAASASHRKPIDPGSWGREAYSANGLSIYLRLQECDGNGQAVLMTVFNRLSAPVPAFQAQAAVPRSLRIALDPASSGGIPPNACLTQLMHISYASDEPTAVDLPKIEPAKLKLRLKITYSLPLSSQSVSEVIDFSNF